MWYKNKIHIVAAALLVAITIFGFNKANYNKQNKPETSETVQSENNDNKPSQKFTAEINFRKTTLTALHGDERAWDLDAAKVQMDEKTNKAVAFKVTGIFYY